MSNEQDILDRYSTPGLRRNTLSRRTKREQLLEHKVVPREDIEPLLDRLYPEEER